jgi:tellurite methyltransferase
MEFIGNKDYWDKKYASRSDTPLSPEQSLVENISYFKCGTVLDIACGDGRNSLFLLENNFSVTGIDYSETALERLRMFADRRSSSVTAKQIDLSLPDSLKDIGIYDNIVMNHYRLNKEQLADLKNHISEDGILFVCGFGHKHPVDAKIKKEDLIQPTDFDEVKQCFELIQYQENQDDRGFFVTYLFRRKG